MKFFSFSLVTLLLATTFGFSQPKPTKFATETNYDARLFLSKTQTVAFNRLYTDFDSAKAIKDWEWKDVDPPMAMVRGTRNKLFV